jgi:hypothetical protein
MEFRKSHPSTNSWLRKLFLQISILHMSIALGPTSQNAIIKHMLASPGLQCGPEGLGLISSRDYVFLEMDAP